MKKILYIFLAAVLALTACNQIEPDAPLPVKQESEVLKVPIEFNITLPTDGPSTKARANDPQVKNIVLAVFGGSGYFNEWVKAQYKEDGTQTQYATQNEIEYRLRAKLSMSESRLRIHVIANCPDEFLENPPITGISSEDLEDVVISKIRSKIDQENSDGYWQKFYIPYGIAAEVDPNGNGNNAYLTDDDGNLIPTTLTVNQFKMVCPIPLVRDFARIKLQNLAEDVTIYKVGLAYAPAEGVIAPILSHPYRVDDWGARVVEVETGGDESHDGTFKVYPVKTDGAFGADYGASLPQMPVLPENPTEEQIAEYNTAMETYNAQMQSYVPALHVLGHELKNATTGADVLLGEVTGSVYDENFVTNYHNLPMNSAATDSDGNTYKLLSDAPYNYGGTAAANLVFAANPTSSDDDNNAQTADAPGTGFVDYDPNGYLYVYERPKPRTFSGRTEKATRIVIYAKHGTESPKYYALDILDEDGNYMPLLRNFTYNVVLSSIATGSGELSAATAADATGANVSNDPRTQDLNEVSDGVSTIKVSYIDATYIKSGTYYVYYQFIPTKGGSQSNKDVTIDWGYDGGEGGYVSHAVSTNGSPFAMTAATQTEPNGVPSNLHIDMDGTSPKLYVQDGNDWRLATTDAEKASAWSRIEYTTTGTAGEAFNTATFGTIRVTGTRTAPPGSLYRDVRINVVPKKTMTVKCEQKFVQSIAGQPEDFVIRIPADITRSMFPLEFKIEAANNSIAPRDGDNLPVQSGKSIDPAKTTGTGSSATTQSAYFFIKTLTRQEYEALPTIIDQETNKSYKEFTCHFKTTKANSATEIYAYNEYFNLAHDNFKNFKQRQFTSNPTTLGDLQSGAERTLRLIMDEADRTNNNNMVWYSDNITDTQQVIPHEVTITMVGVQPQVNEYGTIIDAGITASTTEDGVYHYSVPGNTSPSEWQKDLHLVVSNGDNYSITFSTATCPNPTLYADYTISGRIIKSEVTNMRFTDANGTTINRVLALAGRPVQFRFNYGSTPVPVTFKLEGLTPAAGSGVTGPDANGVYTYTGPANSVIHFTTTDAATECRLYDFTVTDTDTYSQPTTTSWSLTRFKYTFGNTGFYQSIANNPTAMNRVANTAGNTVYYRFIYDSDDTARQDVTITSTGLASPVSTTGTLTANGDHTWTYHPTSTAQNHWITWTTEAVTSPSTSTVTVSSEAYSNNPTASINRRASRTIIFNPSDFEDTGLLDHSDSQTKDGVTIDLNNYESGDGYVQIGYRGMISGNHNGSLEATSQSGETILSIKLTFVSDSQYNSPSSVSSDPTGWSAANTMWTGNSNSVTLSSGNIGGNRFNRVTKIEVTVL